MTDIQLVNYLTNHRGYLKKSPLFLANKLNLEVEFVREVMRTVKKSIKAVKAVRYRHPARVEEVKFKPVVKTVVNTPGTYWITGCTHAPWHNRRMYESTFKYLQNVNLAGIILAGDIADMNSLSSHDRGKVAIKGVTLDWEYKEVNKFLDEVDSISSNNLYKAFMYGNHEDRYLRAIKDVDVSKYGKSLIGPTEGLNLQQRGYEIFEDWKNSSVSIGTHLDVTHGEFLNVHSAKKTIDTYRKSTLYFHTHRFQVYMEGLVAGWNMGAGADFNAPVFGYASRAMKTSWVNSSCLVTLDDNGYYHVEPLLFINNKLIVSGRSY